MISQEVLAQLGEAKQRIDLLLNQTRGPSPFNDVDELIDYGVSANELMLRQEMNSILERLDGASRDIGYLMRPIVCNGTLIKNEVGRYEIPQKEWTSGGGIEALVFDDAIEREKWVISRVEYARGDYYYSCTQQ